MDFLTHSLLGLTSAKAGLEKLSPYATTVCVISANAPDVDVVSGLFGDRWTLLHYHRGITHSIVGVLALGIIIPSIIYAIGVAAARILKRPQLMRYRQLLFVSLVMIATHPIMDWTNNYGLRPLLPWSGRWFYGDLVFIVDPYIWLVLGGAAFMLTSNRLWKMLGWGSIAAAMLLIIFRVSSQRDVSLPTMRIVRVVYLIGFSAFILVRAFNWQKRLGRLIPLIALSFIVCYWAGLACFHRLAFENALENAARFAAAKQENLIRVAAMPTVGNPLRWSCIAETDHAMYRFSVFLGKPTLPSAERFAKPTGEDERVIESVTHDRRAQIFLGFARFPIARLENDQCVGQTLVQFADLRYTEPGAERGSFSLNIPVACPRR